jgi:hypothetical protein
MTQRLLRHKPSGVLYAYQDIYAINPDFEDVEDPNVIDVVAKEVPTQKRIKKAATPAPSLEDELDQVLDV